MSGNSGESPGNSGNGNSGGGPPAHAGPPERVREKFRGAVQNEDGTIAVSDDPLDELASNVDWDNLSAFEEYVVAVLEREGVI
jgi:hypothetical protein